VGWRESAFLEQGGWRVTPAHNNRSAYDCSQPPCDGCPRKSVCADQRLACDDLSAWVSEGAAGKVFDQRVALHKTYQRLFPGAA
jgi:hypothetical protein